MLPPPQTAFNRQQFILRNWTKHLDKVREKYIFKTVRFHIFQWLLTSLHNPITLAVTHPVYEIFHPAAGF